MSRLAEMLAAYPAETGLEPRELAEAVDALTECAGVCLSCADACLGEQDPHAIAMCAKCIRLDLDCADLCTAAARVLLRQTGYDAPTTFATLDAARTVLRACAAACAEMADMEHCRICAATCQDTEALLGALVEAMRRHAGDAYPTEPPSATTPAGAAMGHT